MVSSSKWSPSSRTCHVALLRNPKTRLWMVAYSDRVGRIFSCLFCDVYDTYQLWWVHRDVIAFAHTLGLDMAVGLGSESNVSEVLELLKVV